MSISTIDYFKTSSTIVHKQHHTYYHIIFSLCLILSLAIITHTMTGSTLHDGLSQFRLELEAAVHTSVALVQMSEATTIMHTPPSLHNRYKEAKESDSDQEELSTNDSAAVTAANDNTGESDYDSDSNLSDVIATTNNELKATRKISHISTSSSPRKSKTAK